MAIAFCGNSGVVFLDEPTTGLDPENRRHLWGVLQRARRDCCVILTTHSMEEADALCGRIGIMAYGSLRCLGTSLHLKHKFGDGDKLETHSRWMRGQPADRVVDVAADGFALTADLSGEPALEMTEPDGTVHIEFDLQLAPPDELTGVYTSFDSGCQDGVIVFSSNADGSQVNTLGAWCDDQGNFSRVTPILPWIFESSLQAEIVDPATGERPITFQEAIPTAIQP